MFSRLTPPLPRPVPVEDSWSLASVGLCLICRHSSAQQEALPEGRTHGALQGTCGISSLHPPAASWPCIYTVYRLQSNNQVIAHQNKRFSISDMVTCPVDFAYFTSASVLGSMLFWSKTTEGNKIRKIPQTPATKSLTIFPSNFHKLHILWSCIFWVLLISL